MGVLEYITSLGDNPYFGAGAGLFGIGLLTQFGKKGSVILSTALKRKYILTMEVPCSDQSYGWLMTWITARAAKKTQHLSVQTLFQKSDVTGKVTTKFDFIPSPGIHIMMYKNRFIRVHRERENKMVNFDTGTPWETVTLSTLGTSKQLFIDMLHEAREFGLQGSEGLTSIYKPAGGPPPKWEVFGQPMRPRPLDSVILGEGVSNKLVADVQEFISNSKWYQDRGIPYRRGYLLYGPPGCGKSSFITALAGELQHNICLLNLSMFGMNDDWLSKLMSEAPAESIILLEDIDAAFVSREDDDVKYRGMTRLTLSGMLNAMDGVITSEGRILFMTTNYVEKLDPALIRPGRVDVKQEISYCNEDQLRLMFSRFYPDSGDAMASQFAKDALATQTEISAAQVQALFLFYKETPDHALKMAGILHKL